MPVAAAAITASIGGRTAFGQLDAAAAASARSGGVENPPVAPDLAAEAASLSLRGRVAFVQVLGRIGSDVAPEGFEALAEQRQIFRGATALVVEVDSESGSDAAALRIAEALGEIREQTPLILVVRRAIGPAFLLIPVADRVFVPEPSLPGVIMALQPECDRVELGRPQEAIDRLFAAIDPLIVGSPRGPDALAALREHPDAWQLSARAAYAAGLAEPLDGGLPALGRRLGIDSWVPAGKELDELVRRATVYGQQLQLYRSRLVARALAQLASVNETAGQIALAEQTAASLDPRRAAGAPSLRLEPSRGRWQYTAASRSAWNKSCDAAASAWERVAALVESASRQLRAVHTDIGMLIQTAGLEPVDPLLPEAIDRIERARAELEARVIGLRARGDAAREEAEAIRALRR